MRLRAATRTRPPPLSKDTLEVGVYHFAEGADGYYFSREKQRDDGFQHDLLEVRGFAMRRGRGGAGVHLIEVEQVGLRGTYVGLVV